jgi:hypothetical protein
MRIISRLEQAEALDQVVALGQRAARCLRPRRVRDGLHGVWLGHPLHPVLAQGAIGAWLSAAVLDAQPGDDAAARRLVVFGLAASAPAALAGAADWSEQHEQQIRVGVVHAIANAAAIGLIARHLLPARPVPAGCCVSPGWPPPAPAACWAATSPSAWPAARTMPSRSPT